jgi:hypothetical protein
LERGNRDGVFVGGAADAADEDCAGGVEEAKVEEGTVEIG